MSRRPNPYLIIVALMVLLGLLSLVLFASYSRWLPHPENASRNQLLYWVATRDLDSETMELRRALLERLIAEFDHEQELLQLRPDVVPPTYKERITANVQVLKREWFAWQVERYATSGETRWEVVAAGFLQAQRFIDVAQRLSSGEGEAIDIGAEVTGLVASLPESQRDQGKSLVGDAVVVWLTKTDISKWTREQRSRLAREIASALDARPIESASVGSQWTESEQQQLTANVLLLLETWAVDQALELEKIEDPKLRNAWADARIEQVLGWKLLAVLFPSAAEQDPWQSPWSTLQKLRELTTAWIERAEDSEQQATREMVDLLTERLGAKLVQTWFRR